MYLYGQYKNIIVLLSSDSIYNYLLQSNHFACKAAVCGSARYRELRTTFWHRIGCIGWRLYWSRNQPDSLGIVGNAALERECHCGKVYSR